MSADSSDQDVDDAVSVSFSDIEDEEEIIYNNFLTLWEDCRGLMPADRINIIRAFLQAFTQLYSDN